MIIRPVVPEDVPSMLRIYGGYIGTPVTFETSLPSGDEFLSRLLSVTAEYPWLVCEDGGVVGYAYAHRLMGRAAYAWSAETSVYVDADRRSEGIGRMLYAELLDRLRGMGVVNAFACITSPNPESEGFHASMGFRKVGAFERSGFKDGSWHDVAWYQLDLVDPPEEPSPIGRAS
ncbi:MAG: GNAT family N-acetyltransferase [Thermoplasmata archaeon]|nr:GNAT family N-acetyltransferase [Thermoplasmata archaeon]